LKKYTCFLLLLVFVFNNISAQTVFENSKSEVYPFLNRMSQKGLVEFNDIIQPITRSQISLVLITLSTKKATLSTTEQKELSFYLQEYGTSNLDTLKNEISFFKKDANKRWRTAKIQSENFDLNFEPNIGMATINVNGKSIQQISNGINLWGTIGATKQWAYQLYYRDYTETGDAKNNFRDQSPEQGRILVGTNNDHNSNYSELKANISYTWKTGAISFGKDNLIWGYGENGRIVLSDKSPSYPYIRLDYTPLKWLSFNYTHAWLNSNMVDSNASYNTYTGGVSGDRRDIFISKYVATHSITIKLIKGLTIALGESIVYSDKMDPGFLIPINLFKIYDNNRSNYSINAGSNGQYFFQISSRNQIKNTHLYLSSFIDEIRVSEIFNKAKSRNQLGYTIGGSVTDLFIPYLTLGTEYTRVNPFVYNNLIPAQQYSSYNYSLGDWMGNNFDRALFFAKYTPIPKLKLYARYQTIRKGGPGTIVQQYTAEPQPAFLSDYQKTRKDVFVEAKYEWINNLYLHASAQWMHQNNGLPNSTIYQFGISFGYK
jgi:hypothetical protein